MDFLSNTGRVRHVHFAGIGGVGMSGLAWIMRELGCTVTGCDIATGGHSPDHLNGVDLLVRTSAIPEPEPEIAEAIKRGIPVMRRGELLAHITRRIDTIAVCGTHGKTTTATFIASILRRLAPEKTAWCIGGTSAELPTVAGGVVGENSTLVAEADESDGTLALYTPHITVLTNIDPDHLEHFSGIEELEATFAAALSATRHAVIYNADHQRVRQILWSVGKNKITSFGFSETADYRISDFSHDEHGCVFILTSNGESKQLRLPFPGQHNALNAAAAIAAVCESGFGFDEVCVSLQKIETLPARRFEKIGNPRGFTVISDYAHHPVEIKALINAAKTLPDTKRIVAVFEPHRYTRTKALGAEFATAFDGVDVLVLCPVYAASEAPIAGGMIEDLYAKIKNCEIAKLRKHGVFENCEIPIREIILARSLDDAEKYVRVILREGDVVLCVGAGNVDRIAPTISNFKISKFHNSAIRVGSYGVPAFVPNGISVVKTTEELREIVMRGDAHVIGAGTNTLIAPTGFHGRLIKLEGREFDFMDGSGDPSHIVGAATPGAKLLEFCRANGLSGLEFMTGIPGLVGGWLAMNAGTKHGCFCDAVVSVRAMTRDGEIREISKSELNASYRACPGLRGMIALSVELRLKKSTPEAVTEKMGVARAARFDFSGMRTAGSVFKNPPGGKTAGQILDEAGCKGLRVGGAYVCERHANIIAADEGATASDVLALIGIMKMRARESSGAELETEVEILA
ncbi:MAG: UDP-N-acetylmuramate--L-alanine ligase [Kiritimatiellaeota bacterium]|nr:UDP-N-acetylmuramate--L-alanine ligase [Kiritimatiellota bacterium]